jgi:hypothetical protein
VLKIVPFLLSGFAATFGLLLGASHLLDRVNCLQPEGLGFESAVLSFVQKVRSPIQCVFAKIGLVLLNREDALAKRRVSARTRRKKKEEGRRRKFYTEKGGRGAIPYGIAALHDFFCKRVFCNTDFTDLPN